MIDLLIPVLGRPQNAQPLVESIRGATTLPFTIVFICSRGDTAQIDAACATQARVLLVDGGDNEYARKINHAATHDTLDGEWLFIGADDLKFHPRWDEHALAAHEQVGCRVIGTNDLGNPTVMAGNHATHSLAHRSYVEQGTFDEPGKLLHEGYHHNFVDNEFISTARARSEWVFAKDSHVEHNHWLWRDKHGNPKGMDDQTYEMGRRTYHADSRLWRTRQRLVKAR